MDTGQSAGAVLVIDDEEDLRQLLAFELGLEGYAVSLADSGEAAIALVRRRRFDLAICDLRMPGMGGQRAIPELKALDPALQVVVLTGYATDETVAACRAAGAFATVPKPFDLGELLGVVTRALAERSHPSRGAGTVTPTVG